MENFKQPKETKRKKKDVKAVVEDWCNHRDVKADSSGNRDQPRPHIVTDRTAKS